MAIRKIITSSFIAVAALTLSAAAMLFSSAWAIQSVTPWSPEKSVQNLVYGSSSYSDVTGALGRQPDEIVHSDQMYPVIDNFYYYDENKTGAATVFVFENGMLVGMQYKSPDNQYVDLTYFLQSNGDRNLHYSALGDYQSYYPYFPLYGFSGW
jgi:hypothetical protein